MDDQAEDDLRMQPSSKPELEEDYANNIYIEASVWDVKIIFGQINQFGRPGVEVDWHTAITMPWAQAKILNYYLGLQVAAHELQNGKIMIPLVALPPEPIAPEEGNALSEAVHDLINKQREEFLANL